MNINIKEFFGKKETIIVISAFVIVFSILYYIFFTPNYYEQNAPVRFEIERGESLGEIVDNLYEKGIIPNKFNMKIAAFLYGGERKLKAGRYYVPNGLSYIELVEHFIYGDADYLREVDVHTGSTLPWLGLKLQNKVFIDSSSFVNLCRNKNYIDSLGIKAESLIGYLLPGDYYIYENSYPKEAVGKFYDRFKKFMNDSLKTKAKEMGYSVHEILTLASIVEGETNKVEEMPTVAGVYLNRLKIGMKLQADPTIQYVIPGPWRRLLYKDLRFDSPYNTYRYSGLPPGPINNPGKEAIIASLYPEEHNYFYFVADGTGGHNFAKTYRQHLRNVWQYRRWIREQRRKN